MTCESDRDLRLGKGGCRRGEGARSASASVAALEQREVPYAVIGGNAVAEWVGRVDEAAVRNTRDVDILLRRSDFDAAKAALEAAGFVYRHAASIDMFLDGKGAKARDAVHVIFANEKVRDDDPVADAGRDRERAGRVLPRALARSARPDETRRQPRQGPHAPPRLASTSASSTRPGRRGSRRNSRPGCSTSSTRPTAKCPQRAETQQSSDSPTPGSAGMSAISSDLKNVLPRLLVLAMGIEEQVVAVGGDGDKDGAAEGHHSRGDLRTAPNEQEERAGEGHDTRGLVEGQPVPAVLLQAGRGDRVRLVGSATGMQEGGRQFQVRDAEKRVQTQPDPAIERPPHERPSGEGLPAARYYSRL